MKYSVIRENVNNKRYLSFTHARSCFSFLLYVRNVVNCAYSLARMEREAAAADTKEDGLESAAEGAEEEPFCCHSIHSGRPCCSLFNEVTKRERERDCVCAT